MNTADSPAPPKSDGFLVHLRGHILLFDPKAPFQYDPAVGIRLLLIAVALEALRIGLVKCLYPTVPLLIIVPFLLLCAVLSIPFVAGLKFSQLGLYPWRDWSPTEKSYFIQLLVIANIVFSFVFASRLRAILAQPSAGRILMTVFVPYLFFGFYQEVVYRGMLQTEFVRRWGTFAGILAANVLYTFGPLHWNHLSPLKVPMLVAIFVIGLFFGFLYRRSGNLWIVAIIHGIGNAYIVGSLSR